MLADSTPTNLQRGSNKINHGGLGKAYSAE